LACSKSSLYTPQLLDRIPKEIKVAAFVLGDSVKEYTLDCVGRSPSVLGKTVSAGPSLSPGQGDREMIFHYSVGFFRLRGMAFVPFFFHWNPVSPRQPSGSPVSLSFLLLTLPHETPPQLPFPRLSSWLWLSSYLVFQVS